MLSKSRIAVIGAGPAGLTAALQLQKEGQAVTLFEASNEVGGMAKSFKLWNQIVDLGPHRFFSSDRRVNEFWLDALDNEFEMVNRLTRIYYKGRFFDYPIQATNALVNLGPIEAVRCVLSYLRYKIFPNKNESRFDYWVINRFGQRLFDIFFKSYTEKLWGIPCSRLDADFAAQRIKKLSLYEAIKGAMLGNRKNKHRTLVDEFAYPKLGAGHVYERIADKFINLGGELRFNSPVNEIKIVRDKVLVGSNDIGSEEYDHVVSTMPLTLLIDKLGGPAEILDTAKKLKFRNTILVYLKVIGENPFPDQWIYVHAQELKTGRITNFSNWVSQTKSSKDEHVICLEYWCFDGDQIWTAESDRLIKLATDELYATTLVQDGSIIEGYVRRVPKCYPVYESGYRSNLNPVIEYLKTVDCITPIGRYGSFKYNNQDHSILMGLLAAKNIAQGDNFDLWTINTDYEYQESSRITATGLVTGE